MDRLGALDVGQRAKPVAIDRGKLVILALGGLGHRAAEPLLHSGRAAGEKRLRVLDETGIVAFADAADAGRRATAYLVKQARPRAVFEKAVRTTP
jgi:hypothetical protein